MGSFALRWAKINHIHMSCVDVLADWTCDMQSYQKTLAWQNQAKGFSVIKQDWTYEIASDWLLCASELSIRIFTQSVPAKSVYFPISDIFHSIMDEGSESWCRNPVLPLSNAVLKLRLVAPQPRLMAPHPRLVAP